MLRSNLRNLESSGIITHQSYITGSINQLHHRNIYFATYKHIKSLQEKSYKQTNKKSIGRWYDFPECGKSGQFPERNADEAACEPSVLEETSYGLPRVHEVLFTTSESSKRVISVFLKSTLTFVYNYRDIAERRSVAFLFESHRYEIQIH